jgi:hypothetical protein
VRECELTGLLAARPFLDLFDQDEQGAATVLAGGLASLRPPPAASGEVLNGLPIPFPYRRYDFQIEYCDSETDRVQDLARELESKQKRVWRDIWNVTDGITSRRKNPPPSLRFTCLAVCIGDKTPSLWTTSRIGNALSLQQSQPSLKFVPVIFGQNQGSLKQTFPVIRFWGDGQNALSLLQAAVTETVLSPQDALVEKAGQIKSYLAQLQELRPYLDPAVIQQAQLEAIADLRKAAYGQ